MARLARVVAVGAPHHVTQRGNAGRSIFESDSDRLVYLQLLQQYSRLYSLSLLGYCLMTNHVHLIAVPHRADSLELAFKHAHGRYAAYFNARHESNGHLWQGRFYSCPMDLGHLWRALRYAELNPVRAGLATDAAAYPWSSAAVHCGGRESDALIELSPWFDSWCPADWVGYLKAAVSEDETNVIRQSTHSGRPLGVVEFVRGLEKSLGRPLVPGKGGRPRKKVRQVRHQPLALG